MNENQLYPFERNRYYAGKMLTSIDFCAEQIYMNNKRRFLNQTVLGSGIICGLSVVNLDEISILIESGAAIDELGREIIVEKTLVRKLSVIEGFDKLTGNKAMLCLRYKQEEVHPVHSIEQENYEYNRIREGCELFLMDVPKHPDFMEPEFLLVDVLFQQKDYCIKVRVPSIACRGKSIKLEIITEKISASLQPFSWSAVFLFPMFTTPENEHELKVDFNGIVLEEGAITVEEYWLNTDCSAVTETNILLKQDSFHAAIGSWENEPVREFNLKIAVTDMRPEDVVIRESGKTSLEMRMGKHLRDVVFLAEITMMRTEAAYFIEAIKEDGVKKYITTPAESSCRSRYASYYGDIDKMSTSNSYPHNIQKVIEENSYKKETESAALEMASGTLEIPLQINMKKGDICYSNEIMHGLGPGNVYVEAGILYTEENVRTRNKVKNTIYGDSSLFKGYEHMEIQTAVKVCNDRGCFQVAARLLGEQRSIVLQIKWVAIKFKSEEEKYLKTDYTGMSIIPETPTVRMRVKESHYFRVQFQNMEQCRLTYELTERGSGEISADGIYTAPSTEGVYEIHIRCTDIPEIAAYAYAIVNK